MEVPETDFASIPGGMFRRNLPIPVPSFIPSAHGEENRPSLEGSGLFRRRSHNNRYGKKGRPISFDIGIGFLSEEENNLSDPAEEAPATVVLFPAQRR
jgi:hypothetical protein